MTEITKRQEYILSLIVREYVSAPTPVSSKALVEHYGLDISSATVRNEMAALEEAGLIYAPHTSAGRVPTEDGYRYFVQKLLVDTDLSAAEKRTIRHQFHQVGYDIERWLRLAASVLARTAHSASLVTSPRPEVGRFKHLELISTQGRVVLMVLVMQGGDVRQQMLTLAEPVSQERLSQVATYINGLCMGLDAPAVRQVATRQDMLTGEVLDLVAEVLERADRRLRVIYDGLVNILDPTYLLDKLAITDPQEREDLSRALITSDSPGARQTLHLLEEQNQLEQILIEALSPEIGGVQVVIAGEGRWDDLSHTSMVLSRYGVAGHVTGALGVLGPTRLHYGRAISAVRYVAGLMSDLLIDIYGEEGPPEIEPVDA